MMTDPLALDCASEFAENDNVFAPATAPDAPSVWVVVSHVQSTACATLAGRPLVGVVDGVKPRRLRRWIDHGFLPAAAAHADVLILRTDAGPSEARIVLFAGIALLLFGVAAGVTFLRRLRPRRG